MKLKKKYYIPILSLLCLLITAGIFILKNSKDAVPVLENQYVQIMKYEGVKVHKVKPDEITDEYMEAHMNGLLRDYELLMEAENLEYTDEFVQLITAGERANYDEFLQEQYEARTEYAAYRAQEEEILNAWSSVLENSELLSYDETDLKAAVYTVKHMYEHEAEDNGLSLQDFAIKKFGSAETFNEQVELEALNNLKSTYVYTAIAESEGITVSKDEVLEGGDPEDVLYQKVLYWVWQQAKRR